jgi:hypothetical protein
MLSVVVYNKSNAVIYQPILKFEVQNYSYSSFGGFDKASIICRGEISQADLLQYLKNQVNIYNENDEIIWSGFINTIELNYPKFTLSTSLDDLFNQVKTIYTTLDFDFSTIKYESSWSEDADSIALFGYKQKILDLQSSDLATATNLAAKFLADHKDPHYKITKKENKETFISFECLGFFHTFKWMTYSTKAGFFSNPVGGAYTQLFNWTAENFTVSQDCKLYSVELFMRKYGVPNDGIEVKIYEDIGGSPGGAALGTLKIFHSFADWNYEWITYNFLEEDINLEEGTTYWIVLVNHNSVGAAGYCVRIDEDLGFPGGAMVIWDGHSWKTRSPDADLVFKITTVIPIHDQISIVAAIGDQFYSQVINELTDGVTHCPYYNRPFTCYELLKLYQELGTTDFLSVTFETTPDRKLIIKKQLAPGAADHFLSVHGDFYDNYKSLLITPMALLNKWVKLLPGSALSTFANFSDYPLFFVSSLLLPQFVVNRGTQKD